MNLTEYCTGIADAIREKEGSTDPIPAPEHAERILAIDTQEDLDPELTTQDSLIGQIMTALEGKSAATAVETCTVTYEECGIGYWAIYTAYINGAYETKIVSVLSNEAVLFTFENVVKGSLLILLGGENINASHVTITGGAEFVPCVLDDDFMTAFDNLFSQPENAIKITADATVIYSG